MVPWLKSLNQEQWACGIMILLSLFLLLIGAAGGGAVEGRPPGDAEERRYKSPASRSADRVAPDFGPIWPQGPSPFAGEGTSRLPVPPITPPSPREEDLVAPVPRPFPAFEAYNRLGVAYKYAAFTPGKPLIAEADLPPTPEIDALKSIAEPEPPSLADRRAEKERELDVIYLRTGSKREGKLLVGPDGNPLLDKKGQMMVTVKSAGGGQSTETYPPDMVVKIDRSWTYEEQYKFKSGQLKKDDAEGHFKVALWLRELGMFPEAKDECEKALAIKKDYAEAFNLLGDIFQLEADFDGAFAVYQRALGVLSGEAKSEIHYRIGECLRASGIYEGALESFKQSAVQMRFVKGRLALARMQILLGQPTPAVEAVKDILAKFATDAGTLTSEVKLAAYTVRAMAYLRLGDLAGARSDVAEALKINSQNAEANNILGIVQILEGQWKEGAGSFVAAIKADQYLIEAWTNLASLYFVAGAMPSADALFAAAAQRDPASVEALAGQAAVLMSTGKDKEADTVLARALEIDPGHYYTLYLLGVARLRAKSVEEAIAKFGGALHSEFHFLPAYSGAGSTYLRAARKLSDDAAEESDAAKADEMRRNADGARVKAETLFKTIYEFDPTRLNAVLALACVYLVMDRPGDAFQQISAAREMESSQKRPADPLIRYARGYYEYRFGAGASAEERLERAKPAFREVAGMPQTDESSKWAVTEAAAMVTRIDEWLRTSVRLDESFDRPDSKDISNGWVKSDRKGVSVTISGKRCRFSGSPIEDYGMATLEREFPSEDFYRIEATFYPQLPKDGSKSTYEYGMSLYYQQADPQNRIGVHLGVDAAGRLRLLPSGAERDMDRHEMAIGWEEVKTTFALPTDQITVRLEKRVKESQTFIDVWLYDPAKKDFVLVRPGVGITPPMGQNKNYKAAFFGRGWKGKEYTFYLKNIRIYDRKRG